MKVKSIVDVGDIVICIKNDSIQKKRDLTLYKKYTVLDTDYEGTWFLEIVDDSGELFYYAESRFITQQEYRKRKLLKIKQELC